MGGSLVRLFGKWAWPPVAGGYAGRAGAVVTPAGGGSRSLGLVISGGLAGM